MSMALRRVVETPLGVLSGRSRHSGDCFGTEHFAVILCNIAISNVSPAVAIGCAMADYNNYFRFAVTWNNRLEFRDDIIEGAWERSSSARVTESSEYSSQRPPSTKPLRLIDFLTSKWICS